MSILDFFFPFFRSIWGYTLETGKMRGDLFIIKLAAGIQGKIAEFKMQTN